MVATGGIALTDDLLGQFLGQDLLRRLSRRLGEGAFNGALTARIGIAAIEVIRPLPFLAAKPPAACARSWPRRCKPMFATTAPKDVEKLESSSPCALIAAHRDPSCRKCCDGALLDRAGYRGQAPVLTVAR